MKAKDIGLLCVVILAASTFMLNSANYLLSILYLLAGVCAGGLLVFGIRALTASKKTKPENTENDKDHKDHKDHKDNKNHENVALRLEIKIEDTVLLFITGIVAFYVVLTSANYLLALLYLFIGACLGAVLEFFLRKISK